MSIAQHPVTRSTIIKPIAEHSGSIRALRGSLAHPYANASQAVADGWNKTVRALATPAAGRLTRRNVRNALPYGVLLVPFLQIGALLWLIWARTPQVPYWDEWNTVGVIADVYSGKANIAEFWALHNEHRIVIPRILDVLLISLTHYNRRVELTFDLAVAVGSGLLLLYCVRATLQSKRWVLTVLPLMSLFFFSLMQYDNWIFPFQITFIVTVFGVAVTMAALAPRPVTWRNWSLGALGALISSLSSANGLVVWVAFLPALWGAGRRKIAAWIASGTVMWVLYFRDFPLPVHKIHIKFAVRFYLTFLGAPLGLNHPTRSELIGLAGLIVLAVNLAIWWRYDRNWARTGSWWQLTTYALLTAAIITEGRAPYGQIELALYAKYQMFTALFWVSLIVLSARSAQVLTPHLRQRLQAGSISASLRALLTGALAAGALATGGVLVSASAANVLGFQSAEDFLANQTSHQWCIQRYQTSPDSCVAVFIPAEYVSNVRLLAGILDHYHYALFSDVAAPGQK